MDKLVEDEMGSVGWMIVDSLEDWMGSRWAKKEWVLEDICELDGERIDEDEYSRDER
jgi:hypothetical protein